MVYNTRIEIGLQGQNGPHVRMSLDGLQICDCVIAEQYVFSADLPLDLGEHVLEIELKNKSYSQEHVLIEYVEFEGIRTDRIKWQGVYTPCYPEPWASQQTDLKPELTGVTHLGWNGVWRLRFAAPIFTWIHRVESLGWIYD